MKHTYLFSGSASKAACALVLGAALTAFVQTGRAQYSTTFDGSPFVTGSSVSGYDGWDTNDAYTGSTYNPTGTPGTAGYDASAARLIGQAEGVGSQPNYGAGSADRQALFGGAFNYGGGSYSGRSQVYLFHSTGLSATSSLTFNTDYVVTAPANAATHDNFGWTFRNAQGDRVFSIDFVPTTTNSLTKDNVQFTVGNTATPAAIDAITLGSRYHLTVSVNAATHQFSASITPQNNAGGNNGTTVTFASGVGYTGNISDIAATWSLKDASSVGANGPNDTAGSTNNQAYNRAGSNSLLFDNFSVAVPEPSTFALLGLGACGLAAYGRSRRARQA